LNTISPNGLTVLRKRYLRKKGSTHETPEELFSRVAKDIASGEELPKKKKEELIEAYTNMMANLEFLPNTPTLVNAGTNNGCAYAACYLLDVGDSLDDIFSVYRKAALIQKAGGGVGMDWSNVRPRDTLIKSTGYKTRGVVQFIKIYADSMSVVDQGGIRPSANMGVLSVHHPDILEFINMKHSGAAQNMNISVAITDEFMKAKDEGKKYNLYFPVYGNREKAGELDAKDVWDKIVAMAWRIGDPGILWLDRANRDNPTPSLGQLRGTNPCVVGETLIAVADGRNAVSIKQLTAEGKDIPVYSRNLKTGQVEIKWGRNPRLTGEKKEVWKLTLDDNSTVIATPDHRIPLRDGGERVLKDLLPGDSLLPFNTYVTHKRGCDYRQICETSMHKPKNGRLRGSKRQYQLIYDFYSGDTNFDPTMHVLHHVSCDSTDDAFGNLCKMTNQMHQEVHDITGNKNPMLRLKDPEGYAEQMRQTMAGLNNPSSRVRGAMPVDEWYQAVVAAIKLRVYTRAPGYENVFQLCKKMGIPTPTKFRLRAIGCPEGVGFREKISRDTGLPMMVVYPEKNGCAGLNNPSAKKHGSVPVDVWYGKVKGLVLRKQRLPTWKELHRFYKETGMPSHKRFRLNSCGVDTLAELWDRIRAEILVEHNIEISRQTNKSIGTLDKAVAYWNHKVKSVEFHGYEDVYNITVDDNHNYCIITSWTDTKFMGSSGICKFNCGETWLLPGESCCLGSINLVAMLKKKVDADGVIIYEWDYDKINKTVPMAVRFLDSVLDVSPQPLQEIKDAMMKTRKIGLGVMGFADALIKMKIQYNSMQGLEQAEHIMGYINTKAMDVSVELGKEKGVFPAWELDKLGTARRNAIVTTIAPTGSISLIAGVSSGIEPVYAIAYTRMAFGDKKLSELHADFDEEMRRRSINIPDMFDVIFNEHNGSIQKMNIPDDIKRTFVTAHDILPEWHVRMQAAFQKHTGNSISKTINMKKDSTIEDIDEAYRLSYKLGCKGVTIYRDGSKSAQILSSGVQSQPVGQNGGFGPRVRIEAPTGRTYEIPFGFGDALITVNEDDIGLCEVIVKAGRSGSPISAEAESLGRLVSLLMRCGVSTKYITKQLRGISAGETAFYKSGRTITSLSDAVCAAIENHIGYKMPKGSTPTKYKYESVLTYKQNCPECGNLVIHQSKCIECSACGWSKCK